MESMNISCKELFPDLKLSIAQITVVDVLIDRGVIGEFQDGKTARYELFSSPLDVNTCQRTLMTLLPATFYALYTLGVIEKNNSIREEMRPYGRDNWYVLKGNGDGQEENR